MAGHGIGKSQLTLLYGRTQTGGRFRAAHNQHLKVQSLFSGQFRAVSRDIVVHFLLGHDDLAPDHETEHALPHHVLPGAFPELLQGQPLQAQPLSEVFLGETAAGFQLADFTVHFRIRDLHFQTFRFLAQHGFVDHGVQHLRHGLLHNRTGLHAGRLAGLPQQILIGDDLPVDHGHDAVDHLHGMARSRQPEKGGAAEKYIFSHMFRHVTIYFTGKAAPFSRAASSPRFSINLRTTLEPEPRPVQSWDCLHRAACGADPSACP